MTGRAAGSSPAHSNQSGLTEDHAREWIANVPAAQSLEDPEAYRAFVRTLYAKIEPRLASRLDNETQTEVAELARLLTAMPRKVVDEQRATFETAFNLLATDSPNILVVRSLRLNLDAVEQRSSSLLTRVLLHVCGGTALTAVLAALASIFVLSFLVVVALGLAHRWLSGDVTQEAKAFPFFYAIRDVPIGQVMLLIHAAFFGSIVSILVRIRKFLHPAAFTPLLIYVSVITKPFVAVTFAMLAYAALQAGVVSFLGVDLSGPKAPYVAWALGFLSGFSERFAQDIVIGASSHFGEPHALEPSASTGQRQRDD